VWTRPGNRREYLRGRLEQGRAVAYRNQSSGVLRSAAWADGLIEVRGKARPWPKVTGSTSSR
ncbi:molybdopterin biosynthesis protein MoeA, partial [Pseudomonas syringae pv. japonica str. M301072]